MSRDHEQDLLVLQYLDALDQQDWETYAEIWGRAETDAELEQALLEVHDGILLESQAADQPDQTAEVVRQLVAEHFPEPPTADEGERPLTAGDVASRIRAEEANKQLRLNQSHREVNDQLLQSQVPLPEPLKQSVLDNWCKTLGVSADRHYWRLFRQTALKLVMGRSQQQAKRMAAREQTPKSKEKPSE